MQCHGAWQKPPGRGIIGSSRPGAVKLSVPGAQVPLNCKRSAISSGRTEIMKVTLRTHSPQRVRAPLFPSVCARPFFSSVCARPFFRAPFFAAFARSLIFPAFARTPIFPAFAVPPPKYPPPGTPPHKSRGGVRNFCSAHSVRPELGWSCGS